MHIDIGSDRRGDPSRDDGAAVRDLPSNPPEETRRIEELIDRLLEEHGGTLEKLADD